MKYDLITVYDSIHANACHIFTIVSVELHVLLRIKKTLTKKSTVFISNLKENMCIACVRNESHLHLNANYDFQVFQDIERTKEFCLHHVKEKINDIIAFRMN